PPPYQPPYQPPVYQQPPVSTNNQSFPQWLTAVIMSSIIGLFILGGIYLVGQQNKTQNVTQNTPSPEIGNNYNLTGFWSGSLGNRNPEKAELEIINQQGTTFTGKMRVYQNNGTIVDVSIQGNYNQTNKTIIMEEISTSKPNDWDLALNRGTVADDGLFMSGNSIDAKRRKYKWSFRKNN
ncbi:MAG TPA: hypothetical protein V6C58_19220, partial [Allocoleopsis sp.]